MIAGAVMADPGMSTGDWLCLAAITVVAFLTFAWLFSQGRSRR